MIAVTVGGVAVVVVAAVGAGVFTSLKSIREAKIETSPKEAGSNIGAEGAVVVVVGVELWANNEKSGAEGEGDDVARG